MFDEIRMAQASDPTLILVTSNFISVKLVVQFSKIKERKKNNTEALRLLST